MKTIDLQNIKRLIISRTDSIGDVMLTLPMTAWIKKNYPNIELIYLGKAYTKAIIDCFPIDEFIAWDELEKLPTSERLQSFQNIQADAIIHVFPVKEIAVLAKKARIPFRIGTSHRSFHLLNCNNRVNFTRKNSPLHEAQLNFELLKPFGVKGVPSMEELVESLSYFKFPALKLPTEIQDQLQEKYIILHPKSQGSALEWPIEKYINLAQQLSSKGYQVIFTGTAKEGDLFRKFLPNDTNIIDFTGKLSLSELMVLIKNAEALLACSTGPLHIAGFAGIKTVGLFSPREPIHPGRWAALGSKAQMLVFDEKCPKCKKKSTCKCIEEISVEEVMKALLK